jgi:hypothetical protein
MVESLKLPHKSQPNASTHIMMVRAWGDNRLMQRRWCRIVQRRLCLRELKVRWRCLYCRQSRFLRGCKRGRCNRAVLF